VRSLSQKKEEVSQKIQDLKQTNSDLEALLPYITVSNTNVSTVHLSNSTKNGRLQIYTFKLVKIHVAKMSASATKAFKIFVNISLKVLSSEKVGWSGVTSTLGTLYGDMVMGILL
jgi:hypothetical protein